jgi:hypothetical protein
MRMTLPGASVKRTRQSPHAEAELVALSFQPPDVSMTSLKKAGEGCQDAHRRGTIERPNVRAGLLGPFDRFHSPNSRRISSCGIPLPCREK